MTKKLGIRFAVMTAFLAGSTAGSVAFAVDEVEANNPIGSAQRLEIGAGGGAEVNGVLGVRTGTMTNDLDFYVFDGREGDVVTIDIDGGMKPSGSAERSVDTALAIFGPGPAFRKLRENDDAGLPLDAGSTSPMDARITNFRLPATGSYTVGVTSFPRLFIDGGVPRSSSLNSRSNGSYTLVISGVTPPVQQINIDIRPGDSESAPPVNPKSKGNIPVVLLSSAEFNPFAIDYGSLTFGATGNEASLLRCNREGSDQNGDGLPDLLCHFGTQEAGFEPGDLEGIVKGKTAAGRMFEGRGVIRIVGGNKRAE